MIKIASKLTSILTIVAILASITPLAGEHIFQVLAQYL